MYLYRQIPSIILKKKGFIEYWPGVECSKIYESLKKRAKSEKTLENTGLVSFIFQKVWSFLVLREPQTSKQVVVWIKISKTF